MLKKYERQPNWIVYLVRCSDKSLYCGITNDLEKRLEVHNSGKGAKYTRSRRPVELVGVSALMTKSNALKLEYRVKHVHARNKLFELKRGERDMARKKKKFDRDIEKSYTTKQMVAKLRRLADCLETGKQFKIQIAGEKVAVPAGAMFNIEHEREGKMEEVEFQFKWGVNPKTVKRAPAKKKTVKAKAVKKAVLKKPKTSSAIDTVMGFIQRSKKGIDTGNLVTKTGFNKRKIANVIFKLKKQGKIKSTVRGIYVKA